MQRKNNRTYFFKPKGSLDASSEEKVIGTESETHLDKGSPSISRIPILTPVKEQTIKPVSFSITNGTDESIQVDGGGSLAVENLTNNDENGKRLHLWFQLGYMYYCVLLK